MLFSPKITHYLDLVMEARIFAFLLKGQVEAYRQ